MADLKFGQAGLANETPIWAKWIFRIFSILTTAAAFVVAGDPSIPDMLKVRIMLYLKGADIVILGISNMFGLQPATQDELKIKEIKDQAKDV